MGYCLVFLGINYLLCWNFYAYLYYQFIVHYNELVFSNEQDYYAVLGVSENASKTEIKSGKRMSFFLFVISAYNMIIPMVFFFSRIHP